MIPIDETAHKGGEMTDRIDEIRARREAAPAGPWEFALHDQYDDPILHLVTKVQQDVLAVLTGADTKLLEFIAAAPDDINYLLAELAHYKRALGLAAEDACYYARITLLAQNKFKRECKQDWLKRASDQED